MRTFLRLTGYLALGLVLLVVAAYVATGVVGTFQVQRAKERAVSEVTRSLPAADRGAARQQGELRTRLGRLGAPAYTWRELECTFGSIDAGWIIQDHTQVCEVRTVLMYAVPHAAAGDCERVEVPGEAGAAYVVRGASSSFGTTEGNWTCPRGLTGPRSSGAARLLDGTRPDDLGESPGWVVAQTHTPVSDTVIGCSAWGVLFCSTPYDEPVLDS